MACICLLVLLVNTAWHSLSSVLCGAVLKLAPGDKDAVHSKVAVLIELGRFDEALQAIAACPAAAEIAFEKVIRTPCMPSRPHTPVSICCLHVMRLHVSCV